MVPKLLPQKTTSKVHGGYMRQVHQATNRKNLKSYRNDLDRLGEKLGIKKQHDWYSVSVTDVKNVGGEKVLSQYNNSLFYACQHLYPEFQWHLLQFQYVPYRFWKEKKNQRIAMDSIAVQLNIEQQEDWYHVAVAEVMDYGADTILSLYNNSLSAALASIYPEFEWNAFQFAAHSQYFWRELRHQKQMTDWIAEQLGIETQHDWYSVTIKQFQELGGSMFLGNYYNNSLITALKTIYPQYEWNTQLCANAPHGMWNTVHNHREMMDHVAERLGIETQEDWYGVSGRQVAAVGAGGLLSLHFSSSLPKALQTLYPEYDWKPFLFSSVPYRKNKRKLFDWIAEQLQIETQHDWYNVTASQVAKFGLQRMLDRDYNNSIFRALKAIYSEYEWNPLYSRSIRSHSHFDTPQLQDYIQDRVQTLGIHSLSAFATSRYILHASQVKFDNIDRTFAEISKHFGGKLATLEKFCPHANFRLGYFKSTGESYLQSVLQSSGTSVERNTRIHGHSVDFYLPELGVAFEYQGMQHYQQIHTGIYSEQIKRDARKKRELKVLGITLVEIPYWWKGSFSSLLGTIQQHQLSNVN